MQMKYENHGSNTYLVYCIQPSDEIDTMSLGMITNNHIQGLAKTVFTQMDTTKYLKYDVSAKVSASQVFSGIVNKKQLLTLFSSLMDTVMLMEEYMIDESMLLLDMNHIYMNVVTNEIIFICLPIQETGKGKEGIRSFIKNVLFSVQFSEKENNEYIAKIMNYMNLNQTFSLQEFKKLITGLMKDSVSERPVVKQPVHLPKEDKKISKPIKNEVLHIDEIKEEKKDLIKEPEKIDEKQMSLFYLLQHFSKENAAVYKAQKAEKKNAEKKERTREDDLDILFGHKENKADNSINAGFAIPGQEMSYQAFAVPGQEKVYSEKVYQEQSYQEQEIHVAEMPKGQEMDFGDTVYLEEEGYEETTYLEDEKVENNLPYLMRRTTKEKVFIDRDFFKIGQDAIYADYCIKNPAVSHKHACIIKRENEYFIVDTNSKNHTYINGRKIQSNTEAKLEHGVKINFAKEEFEFYLY